MNWIKKLATSKRMWLSGLATGVFAPQMAMMIEKQNQIATIFGDLPFAKEMGWGVYIAYLMLMAWTKLYDERKYENTTNRR